MSLASQVVVLAGDVRHQGFCRKYLDRLGYKAHDIKFMGLPAGRGCGEQWVRSKYAEAVRAYRARAARAESCLIVVVDADASQVQERADQLHAQLAEAELDSRLDREAIAHFIPRRHIETWIVCLTGEAADEVSDYKRTERVSERGLDAAKVFYESTRRNARLPPGCIPSLALGITEAKRIPEK